MTSPRTPERTLVAAFLALSTALFIALPLAGVARSNPPTGRFLNPEAVDAGGDGPGNVVSDKQDADGRYHIVLRVTDPDQNPITSVTIQVEDGDNDDLFETIGSASLVAGTGDTWEFLWDVGAHFPAGDVDNDAGQIRAIVVDNNNEQGLAGPEAVEFRDTTAETVEITTPANGANLPFFDRDNDGRGEATVSGTGSSGVDLDGEVELYYTTADPLTDPDWIDCDGTVTVDPATHEWTGACELQGSDTAGQVTAVAARADVAGTPATDEDGDAGGDAHRVGAYAQVAQTVQLSPASDTQSIGFCNTFTLTVIDTLGAPIVGANVDVHAVGPADDLQFAVNDGVEGDASDAYLTPSLAALHTPEASAQCDLAGEPDDDPDDNDTDAGGTNEGVHASTGADTKHIEGQTDADGFQFSLDSDTAGGTSIQGWFDGTTGSDDDTLSNEPSATATKTWELPGALNVDGTPEQDTNITGTAHQVTARVTDQNGNPIIAQTVHFRVTAGPHDDNDLDGNISTPNGYFGSCNTGQDGRCNRSYTGLDPGTDTIAVFLEQDFDLFPDPGEPQDPGGVQKTWVRADGGGATCIDLDPNSATNPTDATHELVAFVTNGAFSASGDGADAPGQASSDCSGTPVSDVGVQFDLSGDQSPDTTMTPSTTGGEDDELVATDANGQARVTVDNKNDTAGTNAWTNAADVVGANDAGDKDVSKTWAQAGQAAAIDCEPEFDLNQTGTQHAVTCTVTDAFGQPVQGANVDFQVTAGPHFDNDLDGNVLTPPGYFGEATTDANGQASRSYTGTEASATSDTARGWADLNGDDLFVGGEPEDQVSKTWRTQAQIQGADVEIDMAPAGADSEPGQANTQTCNGAFGVAFGGPTWEASDADDVDTVHLVCVSAQDTNGNVMTGATVTLSSSGVGSVTDNDGPPPSNPSGSAVIDSDGYAEVYIHSAAAGTQTLTASISGVSDTDTGTKTWELTAEPETLALTPGNATNQVGEEHTLTAHVEGAAGQPVQGVTVRFTVTGANTAAGSAVTDADGNARFAYTGAQAGDDDIHAFADTDGDGTEDPGEPADDAQKTWTEEPRCPGYGGSQFAGFNHIIGTPGDDHLVGTSGADLICGRGGDDLLEGRAGGDLLDGGRGSDVLKGQAGGDDLRGKAGPDVLEGGIGADELAGGSGDDELRGGPGSDALAGGSGTDLCVGGPGVDSTSGCEAGSARAAFRRRQV